MNFEFDSLHVDVELKKKCPSHSQVQHKLGTNSIAEKVRRLLGNEKTVRGYCVDCHLATARLD